MTTVDEATIPTTTAMCSRHIPGHTDTHRCYCKVGGGGRKGRGGRAATGESPWPTHHSPPVGASFSQTSVRYEPSLFFVRSFVSEIAVLHPASGTKKLTRRAAAPTTS
ncbi:hypothetical protein JTB14_031366 [Gonioctena quinquepunctata]|nr:hypothetical protein JTB14_031366 [Gonioctena quinquepunctata]